MPATGEAIPSSLSLYMRYRDVGAAVDWLTTTLGFERHTVLTAPDGEVLHAELKFGQGLVMIGPVRNSDFDQYLRQPDEVEGRETQTCYLTCDDADAVYARAKASGAEILLDVEGDTDGRRGFSCRDPQGHIWSIGTYDPWQGAVKVETTPAEPDATEEPVATTPSSPLLRAAKLAGAAGIGTAAVLFGLVAVLPETSSLRTLILGVRHEAADDTAWQRLDATPAVETGALPPPPEQSAAEKHEAAQTLKALQAALERERGNRIAAEASAEKAQADLKRSAEQSRVLVDALKAESQRLERDRASSEDSLRRVRLDLEQAQKARESAEKAAKAAEATLVSERKRRLEIEAELEEAVKTMSGTGLPAPSARAGETEARPAATAAIAPTPKAEAPQAEPASEPEPQPDSAEPQTASTGTSAGAATSGTEQEAAAQAKKPQKKAAEPSRKRPRQAAKPAASKPKARADGGERFTSPLNLP